MNGEDRPLYICIQAMEKQAVDEAIIQIQQFIAVHAKNSCPALVVSEPATVPQVGFNLMVPDHPPPTIAPIQDKIYINLDHAPADFDLLQRVSGAERANLTYIAEETGVSVALKGQGCIPNSQEPLHLLLE